MIYNKTGFLVVLLLAFGLLIGCSNQGGLPKDVKEAFDQEIERSQVLAKQSLSSYEIVPYEIVSAQKGTPQKPLLGSAPDEVWCMTLDREVGISAFSHFLLIRRGQLWEAYGSAYESEFLARECSNW